jgi:hypothetical protein
MIREARWTEFRPHINQNAVAGVASTVMVIGNQSPVVTSMVVSESRDTCDQLTDIA